MNNSHAHSNSRSGGWQGQKRSGWPCRVRIAMKQTGGRRTGPPASAGAGFLRSDPATPATHRRGGAALIVVISLLGVLAFLGFLFYSFAAQEVASAEYFSRSETPDVPLPPDVFWDWSLKQLIVGTDAGLTNSALSGNKYSLLANMLGSPIRDASSNDMLATAGASDLTWGVAEIPPGSGNFVWGDTQPFDGAGITTVVGTAAGTYLTANSPLEFGFDINQDGEFDPATDVLGDGVTPATWANFMLNFSPAADSPLAPIAGYPAGGIAYSGSPFHLQYQPDAGYTYPDINSLFLAYDTTVRGWVDGDNDTAGEYRVIIPSFFRPQLFPTRRGTNDVAGGISSGTNPKGFADPNNDGVFTDGLYTDPQTARQVLRPHVAHIAGPVTLLDPITGNPYRRFVPPDLPEYLGELDADADGDTVPDGIRAKSGDTNRILRPFPFFVDLDGDGTTVGNFNEMGVWTNPFQAQVVPATADGVNYELDVDADGDGIRDSIWLDLDFPMMTLEDGRQFVPMFAVKIIDADALLNVNAHGNTHGLYVRLQDGSIEVIGPDNTPMVSAGGLAEGISFHQSNLGLSPSEVNLSLALTTNLRLPLSSSPVDPRAAEPVSQTTVDDLIATQFELAWNLNYKPGDYPGGPNVGPRMPPPPTWPPLPDAYTLGEGHAPSARGLSNLEAYQIMNGRRVFERLRNGNVRETRQQLLGRHADRFKIRELYRRLAFGDPDYPDGLTDGESLPGPAAGGFNLDDDGDSNQPGLAAFFGGPGDDDLDAPGVGQPGDATDDNFKRGGGSFYYDQDLYGVQIPPSVHPLDYLGTGSGIYNRDTSGGTGLFLGRQLGSGGVYTNPNPSVFPTYLDPVAMPLGLPPLNLWHYNGRPQDDSKADLAGVIPWRLGLNAPPFGSPMAYLQFNNGLHDFLIDEPNEVILEPELRNPEYDSVFPVHEMEWLHLSRSDVQKVKGGSRLAELATINLKRVREEVRRQIARRLTTDSWDRLEPGQTRWASPDGSTPAFRFFEYNGWTGAGPDFFTDGVETFPPEYGPAATPIPAGSMEDPLRPELRLLLKNERLYSGSVTGDLRYPRQKLSINRILSGENGATPGPLDIDRRAFDTEGDPRFRQLTPHPNITQLLTLGAIDPVTIEPMVHDNFAVGTDFTSVTGPPAGVPPIDNLGLDPTPAGASADRALLVEAQEWWARYDRQRMARDIYTLLYTLGAGDDGFDPTAAIYPITPAADYDVDGNGINDLVDQMAQFAVNVVDGLDHDNVITRFEYDGNLSDGWQWSVGGTANDYVNGVEAQQLTFSEVVWTRTNDEGSDYASTPWDDDDGHHQFLHMELRSTTPFPVELADETWRIVRTEPQVGPNSGITQQARVTFQRNPGMQALVVPPGENFTIGASDKGAHTAEAAIAELPADFYLGDAAGSTWECVVPAGTSMPSANPPAMQNPRTDLDLVANVTKPPIGGTTYGNYQEYFTVDAGSAPTGPLINLVGLTVPTTDDSATTEFDLVLQRRRHLNAEGMLGLQTDTLMDELDEPPSSDWIEVDRIRVTANNFDPADNADVPMARQQIVSQYRFEPLSAPDDLTQQPSTVTGDAINHTIADLWDAAGTAENPDRDLANVGDPGAQMPATEFTLWQPHFDRDYSSIFELLAVPLFGPERLTRRLAYNADPATPTAAVTGTYYDAANPSNPPPEPQGLPSLAGRLFMQTDPGVYTADPMDNTDPAAGTGFEDDNRWYRVLEYLEVPGRAEEAVRERLTRIVRTPGKINLNTLRDEQALAALVDDLFILKFDDENGRMTTTDADLETGSSGGAFVPPGTPATYVNARNWMDELRLARDGIDPVNYFGAGTPANRTYLPLPGIPGMVGDPTDGSTEYAGTGRPQFGALPFRPLSYVNPLQALDVTTGTDPFVTTLIPPTAHTILRNHVGTIDDAVGELIDRTDDLDALQLFEARPTTDLGTDAYDYHTRNRLLAKVANNTTERSNVFICWIVVEFFEAHQPDPVMAPEVVQVGGKLEGSPTHRGFFVIDRSRIERAVDQDSITNAGNGNGHDDNFKFDWREFVIHRRTIQ